jgi:tetratricopeptide (TPR) repeat protein
MSKKRTNETRLALAAAILLVAATIAAFGPAFRGRFVDWDDFQNLTRNEHIRGFSPENLAWMLTSAHLGVWQPLAWFAAAAEYRLFGGADEVAFSRGMHAASVLLHASVALLVFSLYRAVFAAASPSAPRRPAALVLASLFGALFFAVHPLRSEVVAWATATPYILALLFALASVRSYLDWASTRQFRSLLLAWLLFGASLLCKSIAVALPLVLLLLDWHPLGRVKAAGGWFRPGAKGIWLEKIPFALLSAAVTIIAPLAKESAESTISWSIHGPVQRAAQAAYGFFFYPLNTVIPAGLSPIYEIRLPIDPLAPRYLVSILLVLALVAALVVFGRRFRTATAVVLGYAFLVLPVLGFLQSGSQEVADRYAYLPGVALSAGAGALFFRLWESAWERKVRRAALAALSGAAIVVLAALAWRQAGFWRDTESLWTRAAAVRPGSTIAQNGYGYVLLQRGETDEAVRRFEEAIRIHPDNEMAHRNLWTAYRSEGKDDALLQALQRSARVFPEKAEVRHFLGNEYARQRRFPEAIAEFRAALARDPNLALSHRSLATALETTGDARGASEHARRALELDPSLVDARLVLARALRAEGKREEAKNLLLEGIRLAPAEARMRRMLESLAPGNAPGA